MVLPLICCFRQPSRNGKGKRPCPPTDRTLRNTGSRTSERSYKPAQGIILGSNEMNYDHGETVGDTYTVEMNTITSLWLSEIYDSSSLSNSFKGSCTTLKIRWRLWTHFPVGKHTCVWHTDTTHAYTCTCTHIYTYPHTHITHTPYARALTHSC